MQSHLLRDPIDIYQLETIKTEYGTIKSDYVPKYHTRSYVKFNSENQVVSEGEIFYPINRTFIVRAYVPVVESDRIFWQDKWWKILSINQNKYYNDIEIICTLVNE